MISTSFSLGFWLFSKGLAPVFLEVNLEDTFCLKVIFLLLTYSVSQLDSYIEEIKSQMASPNPFRDWTLLMLWQPLDTKSNNHTNK